MRIQHRYEPRKAADSEWGVLKLARKDMGFTLEAMRLPLEALGYEIVGELAVFGIFEKGKVKEKKEILVRASNLGVDLAESLLR